MAKCIFGGDGKRGVRMQINVGCRPRLHRQNQTKISWIFQLQNTVNQVVLIPIITRINQNLIIKNIDRKIYEN